jgi:probable F420-dependent oxidoreductase
LSPRVHISCGFLGESALLELIGPIEQLGFDGVTLPDHVFLPDNGPGTYPYSADGKPPFRPDTPWPDPLVMAGAIGARTTRLHVSTIVYVLPARNPLLVAKSAATAALLCQGRFAFGVGVGWQREEFDALGVDFHRRGALTDEAIVALRELWRPGVTRHDGAGYRFGPLLMEPTPPAIPIIVGGGSDAAIRRAAVLGDGYVLPTQPLSGVPEQLERVRRALDDAGRDAAGFRVIVPCLQAPAPEIASMLDPLVTDIVVMPWAHPGKVDTTIEQKLESLDAWVTSSMEVVRMGVSA